MRRASQHTRRTPGGLHQRTPLSPGNQGHLKEEAEVKLCNQLLLQGLAGLILRRAIVSGQRQACAIIKVERCVYNPDLSRCMSATLDDRKGQVKDMSDENLPFWTLVLSWVKGDWWNTIFAIVTVALIVLLCGPLSYSVL